MQDKVFFPSVPDTQTTLTKKTFARTLTHGRQVRIAKSIFYYLKSFSISSSFNTASTAFPSGV